MHTHTHTLRILVLLLVNVYLSMLLFSFRLSSNHLLIVYLATFSVCAQEEYYWIYTYKYSDSHGSSVAHIYLCIFVSAIRVLVIRVGSILVDPQRNN